MAIVLAHLLTAYAVLLAPWLGCWSFQLAQRRIAAGVPGAKLRFYRTIVAEQIATTAAVLFLCYSGRFSFAGLGVVSPHSWGLTLAILAIVVGLLVWSSLKLRPKADKLREKIKDRGRRAASRFAPGAALVRRNQPGSGHFRRIIISRVSAFLPRHLPSATQPAGKSVVDIALLRHRACLPGKAADCEHRAPRAGVGQSLLYDGKPAAADIGSCCGGWAGIAHLSAAGRAYNGASEQLLGAELNLNYPTLGLTISNLCCVRVYCIPPMRPMRSSELRSNFPSFRCASLT